MLVAGAGALGNEALKNLALLGVGRLLVVDFDRIERSNLSRTVLFSDADIGQPKARVAARAAARLNPDVSARGLDGDLFFDVGLGLYRRADLVVGGLDNLGARVEVAVSCALAGVPYLDGGMWALGGEVRWFLPGAGPCFACTLDSADWERVAERHSCTGLRLEADEAAQHVPTTISTAAIIGGLLAQEAARYLCGLPIHAGEAAVYDGPALTMHRAALSRDPACPYHQAYADVAGLPQARAATLTGAALLARARADLGADAVLELGRDFLLAFACRACGRREPVGAPVRRVPASRETCPHCGAARVAETVSRLTGSEACAALPLAALGAPPGEVLAAWSAAGQRLYELTGDVDDVWGT